jgi:hypothetical protein
LRGWVWTRECKCLLSFCCLCHLCMAAPPPFEASNLVALSSLLARRACSIYARRYWTRRSLIGESGSRQTRSIAGASSISAKIVLLTQIANASRTVLPRRSLYFPLFFLSSPDGYGLSRQLIEKAHCNGSNRCLATIGAQCS